MKCESRPCNVTCFLEGSGTDMSMVERLANTIPFFQELGFGDSIWVTLNWGLPGPLPMPDSPATALAPRETTARKGGIGLDHVWGMNLYYDHKDELGMGLLVIGWYAVHSTSDRYGSQYEYISWYASRYGTEPHAINGIPIMSAELDLLYRESHHFSLDMASTSTASGSTTDSTVSTSSVPVLSLFPK